ncbi:hypothetical protein AMR72_06305 [Flavobacterium psychrophilum]|nr:hypothetical protein AMR72_06305 [Flavobacterium psychrophilum]AOE52160.1 hypothetical protein ALW18_06295 [Flavobacterium psychrophilum]
MKILIADDHSVVRQGVSLILREFFTDMKVIQVDTFNSTLDMLNREQFDLLLLDINLPGGNSVSMINKIRAIQLKVKILVFSAYDEDQYALRYIQAGADGYLNKLSSEEKIIEAVSTILNGELYIGDTIKNMLAQHPDAMLYDNPFFLLSNREMEITLLLVNGEGNLEIANKLNIRMSTVSTYKSRIFEKLGVSNVVSLAEKYRLHANN